MDRMEIVRKIVTTITEKTSRSSILPFYAAFSCMIPPPKDNVIPALQVGIHFESAPFCEEPLTTSLESTIKFP